MRNENVESEGQLEVVLDPVHLHQVNKCGRAIVGIDIWKRKE